MKEKVKQKPLEVLKKLGKRWFVDAMGAMAFGLFASLIIGVIINQINKYVDIAFLKYFEEILGAKSPVVGAAIGVAVAYGLKTVPLAMYSSAATGAVGYMLGGPAGCFVASLVGAEIGNLIAGKTRLDILLVPFTTLITGGFIATIVGPPIMAFMEALGAFINMATEMQPFLMGIIVSVVVGMVLTAPISSAALCIMLNLSGLAAGAATAGCCANMIGFAVISFKDNNIGGSLAQGLGTSMLQVPNIVKKPLIWIPPIVASAILGPISTMILKMTNNAAGAGMGTSGLVGTINTYIVMTEEGADPIILIIKILAMQFVFPALISLGVYVLMKHFKWIKDGEMKLNV